MMILKNYLQYPSIENALVHQRANRLGKKDLDDDYNE